WLGGGGGPAERGGGAAAPAALDVDAPQPLGAVERADLGAVPLDLGAALEVEQIAAREVDEHQRGARIGHQVAEGVEVAVAAVVGDGEDIAVDPDEAGWAAAMRDGDAAGRLAGARGGRDEEGIGGGDRSGGRAVEAVEPLGGSGGGRGGGRSGGRGGGRSGGRSGNDVTRVDEARAV